MNLKQRQNMFHVTVNANAIVQLAFQVKNGIIKLVNVNVKIIVHAKRIIVGILGYGFISDYITINNYYYLLSLCTTKMH